MKESIGIGQGLVARVVPASDRLAHGRETGAQRLELVAGDEPGGMRRHAAFQEIPGLAYVLRAVSHQGVVVTGFVTDRRRLRSFMQGGGLLQINARTDPDFDFPLQFEHDQGLAQAGAGDPEPLGEFAFGRQAGPFRYLHVANFPPQGVGHMDVAARAIQRMDR